VNASVAKLGVVEIVPGNPIVGSGMILPAPSKSRYPIVEDGWDELVEAVTVATGAVAAIGLRTKAYNPLRLEVKHPF
jgi:hypothetical protein